jgi:hydrogenase nickel incorporation protein HypA/HybF
LLRQVEDLMYTHGADRVLTVGVGVGRLAGVEPDLFQSAFEELVEESPVRGAALRVTTIPVELRCSDCEGRSELLGFRFVCPHCGSGRVVALCGEGVILESVTLELEQAQESSRIGAAGSAGGPCDE